MKEHFQKYHFSMSMEKKMRVMKMMIKIKAKVDLF
jgi:hypothetical protein